MVQPRDVWTLLGVLIAFIVIDFSPHKLVRLNILEVADEVVS